MIKLTQETFDSLIEAINQLIESPDDGAVESAKYALNCAEKESQKGQNQ